MITWDVRLSIAGGDKLTAFKEWFQEGSLEMSFEASLEEH